MRCLLAAGLLVFVAGCHPLACFHPADLPRDPPLSLSSEDRWPRAEVQIDVDDLGIPHLYGTSEPDLAYALGVMHARDRLFQMFLYVHAGEGRLTELLGADLLEVDRQNRILMHGVDELIAAFGPRDRETIDAYCAGVNEGARMVGRSAEMAILGVDWEPLTPRDVIAVARLQQWDQSVGFFEEMSRHRLLKELGKDSPVAAALLADSPSGGVPIVSPDEHDGAPFAPPAERTAFHAPATPRPGTPSVGPAVQRSRDLLRQQLKDDLAERFSGGGTGASNSWSLSPDKTAAGVAILANDPHLGHSAPGVFYMVDMHLRDGDAEHVIAGGSFPGIPAVLIGHGRHIAWGITNSYADTQDVVVLERPAGLDDSYVVDGQRFAFGEVTQKFRLGKGDDAEVVAETWQTSIFGPVLPPGYGSYGGARALVDEDERLALLWTAQQFPAENSSLISAFWDLAKSRDIDEAGRAVQLFAAPAMNINMAFTDGTIAYRLSGIVPVRGDEQRVDYPRRGSTRAAGWTGPLAADQKPQTTNPPKGYIVAANQRIVDNGVVSQRFVGFESAQPWRAMRIDQRLRELLADGKPSTEELLGIQQDVESLQAQTLAPILGAHCPKKVEGHDDERVRAFCEAIAGFDGSYTVDAIALPYTRTAFLFSTEVLRAHVHPELAEELARQTSQAMALYEIVKAEHDGTLSPVLDDPRTPEREGIDGFMARATKAALDLVVTEAGGAEADWRWGKSHTLSLRGALSSAPVIGFLFQTDAREQSGISTVPRAEAADFNKKMRVHFGAGLRLIAEMSDPPNIRMINDSGNSGHFGHRHLEDQYPLWTRGEPRVLSLPKKDAESRREGALVIKPKS